MTLTFDMISLGLDLYLAGDGRAHMTADEMDEQRKQNVAYEYLCHLEEAKVFVF